MITAGTKVVDVIDHPLFSGFGRLIFPTAFGRPDPAMTLRQVGSLLLYHHCVRAETTVDVIRALLCERAQEYLAQGAPVMVLTHEWGGHWQVVIGYDDMGTEATQDDVLILMDPYDTTDHNQDGYLVESYERLAYDWGNSYDADVPYAGFVVMQPAE